MEISEVKKPKSVVKRAIFWGVVYFLILTGMRLYSGYLEQEVAVISRAIEQMSVQEVSLRQQLSTLKSSNRVYSYCLDKLKMQKSTGVGVLIID